MSDIKIKIKESTLDLVVQHGFEGATISKIVKHSGISNGGIYSNFSNREAIFVALYTDIKAHLNETILFDIRESDSCHHALHTYWTARTSYGLKNHGRLKYIDLFVNSPYYALTPLGGQYDALISVMDKSMKQNELIQLDIDYLLIDINSNINSLLKYAQLKPDLVTDAFIDAMFKKYWRSVINLSSIF